MNRMEIRFGNLSPEEMSKRMGWNFNEDDLAWLKAHHIESAQLRDIWNKNGFHIFDLPFQIVCAPTIAEELVSILKKYDTKSKGLRAMSVVILNKDSQNE